MAGIIAVLKRETTREKLDELAEKQPEQSKCIRIERSGFSTGIPIARPVQPPPQPPAAVQSDSVATADTRRKAAETSAEVRLISALVFSLYQLRISDPAVLCTATAFCLTRDCPTWRAKLITGALARPNLPRIDNVLVVCINSRTRVFIDFEWRERFRLRRTIPQFDAWFNSVSPVMVAPEASLISQVRHNCLHCRNCFLALSMEIPPWRRPESIISAYLTSQQVAIDVKPLCGYLLETLNGDPALLETDEEDTHSTGTPSEYDSDLSDASNSMVCSTSLSSSTKSVGSATTPTHIPCKGRSNSFLNLKANRKTSAPSIQPGFKGSFDEWTNKGSGKGSFKEEECTLSHSNSSTKIVSLTSNPTKASSSSTQGISAEGPPLQTSEVQVLPVTQSVATTQYAWYLVDVYVGYKKGHGVAKVIDGDR